MTTATSNNLTQYLPTTCDVKATPYKKYFSNIFYLSGVELIHQATDKWVQKFVTPFKFIVPHSITVFAENYIKFTHSSILSPLRERIFQVVNAFTQTLPEGSKFSVGKRHIHALVAPILEELHFRYLIQKVLLKELPRKILQKIKPSNAKYVDHTLAKILRVVLTASFFTLMHFQPNGYCRYYRGELTQIQWGDQIRQVSTCYSAFHPSYLLWTEALVYSLFLEFTNSIFLSSILHIIHNLQIRSDI